MKIVSTILISLLVSSLSFAESYHVTQIDLEKAHQMTLGSEDVVIADMSTGLNYHLGEFSGRVQRDENGGYGFDAVLGSNEPLDSFGLGTQTASIMVGNTLGIAPRSKIIPIRIFDDNGAGYTRAILDGINYAIHRNVNILLLSAAIFGESTELICEGLREAERNNVLIVASAGNSGEKLGPADYPTICKINNMLVVATNEESKKLAPYSSFGFRSVHTSAPGSNLEAMDHTGRITNQGRGGIYSAAVVAGVAALVMSHHTNYSLGDVKTAIIRGSVQNDFLSGKVMSNGIVNAYNALTVSVE